MYKKGFTLAEVLITLAVIGVVAAMTIPSLMNNTNDAELKAQYKKIYAEFGAWRNYLQENNEIPVDDFDAAFAKYFSITKKCSSPQTDGCWHADGKWTNLYGNAITGTVIYGKGYVLSNGAYVVRDVNTYAATTDAFRTDNTSQGVFVDVNGAKGPNQVSKDIFAIELWASKVLPGGAAGGWFANSIFCNRAVNSTQYVNGMGCGTNVIMDRSF